MGYHVKLTVKDVLRRPLFESADIIAGGNGLHRIVDWVHIVEIAQISHLLNGNELILSTGVGWGAETASCLSFFKQLIERGAAGLCVELGTYMSHIPEELIQLADAHNFPLIVFTQEVRFVDITQDLHAVLHETEKKRIEQDQRLLNWLQGQCTEEEICRYVQHFNLVCEPSGVVACIARFEDPPNQNKALDSHRAQFTILSQSAFTQQGFLLLSTFDQNQLIYIVIAQNSWENWKCRIEKGIAQLQRSTHVNQFVLSPDQFSIGQQVDQLSQLPKSFQAAQEVLEIQEKMGSHDVLFFEDLHIYRMIILMDKAGKLHDFVTDYLQPVIEYDRTRQGDMMHTLKTFLACHGSKQETAARLFIVRQTLYHRLEKLEQLLGADFMNPKKRLAIECALYAYDYLRSSGGRPG